MRVAGGERNAGGSHRAASVLQQVGVVDRGRPTGAEDRHDDRQTDHDLGRGDDHHEERNDLAVEGAVDPRERDQREIDRVEHQLDAHEDHDGVAADEHTRRADREQEGRQIQVVIGTHDSSSRVSTRGRAPEISRYSGTLVVATLPSGSSAGVSIASWSAYTPGPGRGAIPAPPVATRSRMRSSCVRRGVTRSRWASTMAPRPAVISRALVASNAKTYLLNRSSAIATTLPLSASAPATPFGWKLPRVPARATTSSAAKPSPTAIAATRCPRSVSTSESVVSTPMSISTNRNNISTAPV